MYAIRFVVFSAIGVFIQCDTLSCHVR
jgi:hypothetical protein